MCRHIIAIVGVACSTSAALLRRAPSSVTCFSTIHHMLRSDCPLHSELPYPLTQLDSNRIKVMLQLSTEYVWNSFRLLGE
ncbi:hypothetical protein F4819DRAFT_444890 [Hypoxylon fuscum]|nr:hypothetical protein F4819DRAFT_444890 [Hypoxylon fuscum]